MLQTLAHNPIEEATEKPDLDQFTVALPKSEYLPNFLLDPVGDEFPSQSKKMLVFVDTLRQFIDSFRARNLYEDQLEQVTLIHGTMEGEERVSIEVRFCNIDIICLVITSLPAHGINVPGFDTTINCSFNCNGSEY